MVIVGEFSTTTSAVRVLASGAAHPVRFVLAAAACNVRMWLPAANPSGSVVVHVAVIEVTMPTAPAKCKQRHKRKRVQPAMQHK